MQLKRWQKSMHLDDPETARLFRTSPENLRKWKTGRLPRPEKVTLIYRVTKGMVGPNDFYRLPKLAPEDPQAAAE